MEEIKFCVGDQVRIDYAKNPRYDFDGVVLSVFRTLNDDVRVVVEDEVDGRINFFSQDALELVTKAQLHWKEL